MTEIKKLIEAWNARPQRVEPDNETHLLYIFTGLLPVLREAMPRIVALIEPSAPATGSPSTDLPPAPAPEPNTHNPGPTPNTDGSVEVPGPVVDTGGTPAILPASAGEIAGGASKKRPGAGKRARSVKARKLASAPPEQPQGTAETVTA